MAILKGLSPRMAEVGKIKIGGKGQELTSKTGTKYRQPVRFDHFVVTTTERDVNGDFKIDQELMAKLGKDPRELKIRLPFDSIDIVFFTEYQRYTGNKKVCSGNGIKATTEGRTVDCNPDTCDFFKNNKCKVTGILSCFLEESKTLGAVHKFRTHSYNAVASILASLDFIANRTNGILMGLPLKLVMVKKTTAEHGTIDFVTIVIDGEGMDAMRDAAMHEIQARKLLNVDIEKIESAAIASGIVNDNDNPQDIQEEFYPEPVTVRPLAERIIKRNAPPDLFEDK